MALRPLLSLVLVLAAGHPALAAGGQATTPPTADAVVAFVDRLRDLALRGDTEGVTALSVSGKSADEFVRAMTPAPTALVIKERDRTPLPDGAQRLLLEVFSARETEARVFTWQMDVSVARGSDAADPGSWRVARLDRLSFVSGLFKLGLDTSRQFDVRNLTVKGADITLQMATGAAFIATTPDGPTGIVLLGPGRLQFSPPDPSERTQIRIFSGNESLTADFDAVLLRIRPSDFATSFPEGTLTPRVVVSADARRASNYFDEYIGRTLNVDLNDLSRDRWSLLPQPGDLIAEVRTKRYGTLTYARIQSDAEDVSFFDRRRKKNIAVYASRDKLETRGRFYSEDEAVDYDVTSYDLEADFSPERLWIDGRARLALKIVAPVATSITLKIAEPLIVRSVYTKELGRLMFLRVVGQNAVIINFPMPVVRGTALNVQVVYGGRIEPQELDREAISLGQEQEPVLLQPEPRYIYSNRSYWYPQATVGDYATARIEITVPSEYDAVASGTPAGPPARAAGPVRPGERARKMFVFNSDKPLRYLACVISRFNVVTTANLVLPSSDDRRATVSRPETISHGPLAPESPEASLSLSVLANPRQASRGRGTAERTTAIFQFYASIVGDVPYPSFTVALSESDLPGGHSPAYFAILNQPLPTSPFVWRNDPVSFSGYPTFFLAHELGHQWWGQAVGWKNYHEQWISEGFAQYFATMYAEKERGAETFTEVLRQMRRWAIEASPQGPVYLGYRLGHIKGDSRTFRAVIYNKAAMVLHMLRRLVGDDAFFRGIQMFYAEWQFRKAGTDDFRVAMEKASSRDLSAFFESWIYRTEVPQLQVRHTVEGSTATVTVEHRGEVIPVPVTITLVYTSGSTERLTIPVTERTVTRTLPLTGTLRALVVNQEDSVALFDR
jgi:Peptidase family M1 domain